jgi:putative oxidoreductase
VRRLYPSFARGAPGVGLVLMRVAVATGLIVPGITSLIPLASGSSIAFGVFSLLTGVLLLIGLWTPVAGVLAAVLAIWLAPSVFPDLSFHVLIALIGLALALLGPGAWSVDARLFGWRRVEIRNGGDKDNDRQTK